MKSSQIKNASFLFVGNIVIKFGHLVKQILLAFFLGVSADIDLFLAAQIVPAIINSMIGGGAGEVLITNIKNRDEDNTRLVVLFTFGISLVTILLGVLYLFSVPVWLMVFNISAKTSTLFWTLSIILIINLLPAALISTFKNLLYYKNKYSYYIYTSLLSEVIGIIAILLLVKQYGIIAFALGVLVTTTVNAILFFNIHGLSFKYLVSKEQWKLELNTLKELFRKVFSLSLQTLINHLSTFWERTLSIRYLTPGYLSALNYSKSLTDMPRTIMLSSILTTTYVEQVKKRKESLDQFIVYSRRMEGVLDQLSFAFQILSIVFAPLILIVLFRRGQFDNEAVKSTLLIYQILTVGFVPGLMMNFLSRTMYIVSRYKQLLYFVVFKFLVELLLMISLIKVLPNAIPVALTVGKFFFSIILFWYLTKEFPNIFNKTRFWIIYLAVVIFSLVILYWNQSLLPLLIYKSTIQIVLLYIPLFLLFGIISIFYLNKLGYLQSIFKKLRIIK